MKLKNHYIYIAEIRDLIILTIPTLVVNTILFQCFYTTVYNQGKDINY